MFSPQLHNTSVENLTPSNYVIQSGGMKPLGAFWTSTYNEGSSDWLQWCEMEMPDWVQDYTFVLTVEE